MAIRRPSIGFFFVALHQDLHGINVVDADWSSSDRDASTSSARLVFQQTPRKSPFGWLVDPVWIALDEFADASIDRFRVEAGI
jgi:hypothetical protein